MKRKCVCMTCHRSVSDNDSWAPFLQEYSVVTLKDTSGAFFMCVCASACVAVSVSSLQGIAPSHRSVCVCVCRQTVVISMVSRRGGGGLHWKRSGR